MQLCRRTRTPTRCARATTSRRRRGYDTSVSKWWIRRRVVTRRDMRAMRHRRVCAGRVRRARTMMRVRDARCTTWRSARCRSRARHENANEPGHEGRALCSPEQIRTAVTALRGRRPGPLDDGAGPGNFFPISARGGGLEPPTTGPEPAVLPITPPPKGDHRDYPTRSRSLTVGHAGRVRRGQHARRAAARATEHARASRSRRTPEDPGRDPRWPRRRQPSPSAA